MSIEFYDNLLTADDFLCIHKEMKYEIEPREQIEQALKKGLFSVVAKDNGKAIVSKLIDYARQNGILRTSISISLMSAKGKENFYEELGFIKQPSNNIGSGMIMDIDIE